MPCEANSTICSIGKKNDNKLEKPKQRFVPLPLGLIYQKNLKVEKMIGNNSWLMSVRIAY
jgi:hypothetical protein